MNVAVNGAMAAGIGQGLFICLQLWTSRRRFPVIWWHLLVGAVALTGIIFEQLCMASGLWRQLPHVLLSTTWMPLLIGPVIWLFVKSLDSPKLGMADTLHYVPALFALACFVPFYTETGEAKIVWVESAVTISWPLSIFGVAKAASMIGYVATARFALRRKLASQVGRLTRRLAQVLTLFLGLVTLVFLLFVAEQLSGELFVSSDTLAATGTGLLLYAISLIVAAEWREIAAEWTKRQQYPASAVIIASDSDRAPRTELLDRATATALYAQVLAAVKERQLYRRAEMKIDQLASLVGISTHYLSYVINEISGRNYQSWLNGLRVDCVKEALRRTRDRPLIEIALEAGFNSKASFNRAFKAETGTSPTEYARLDLQHEATAPASGDGVDPAKDRTQ